MEYVNFKVITKFMFVWKSFYIVFVLPHTCPCTTESILVYITSALVTFYNRFLSDGLFSQNTNKIVYLKKENEQAS